MSTASERPTVEEHLEANTIGTVIHKAVELGLKTAVGGATSSAWKEILAWPLDLTKPGANPHAGENPRARMAAAMIGRCA